MAAIELSDCRATKLELGGGGAAGPSERHGDERSQGERSPPPGVATTTLLSVAGAGLEPDAAQMERLRRAPVWGVTCNNIAFMAVPRSVPACFAATGWVAGLACLAYSSVVTYDTGVVLGQVCVEHPSLTSFPLLVGEACARRARRCGRDVERWRAAGHAATTALQFATCASRRRALKPSCGGQRAQSG